MAKTPRMANVIVILMFTESLLFFSSSLSRDTRAVCRAERPAGAALRPAELHAPSLPYPLPSVRGGLHGDALWPLSGDFRQRDREHALVVLRLGLGCVGVRWDRDRAGEAAAVSLV